VASGQSEALSLSGVPAWTSGATRDDRAEVTEPKRSEGATATTSSEESLRAQVDRSGGELEVANVSAELAMTTIAEGLGHDDPSVDFWKGKEPEGALPGDAFTCDMGRIVGIRLPARHPNPETSASVQIDFLPELWPLRVFMDIEDARKQFFLFPPVPGSSDHWRLSYRRLVREGVPEYAEDRLFEVGQSHPCGPDADREVEAAVVAWGRDRLSKMLSDSEASPSMVGGSTGRPSPSKSVDATSAADAGRPSSAHSRRKRRNKKKKSARDRAAPGTDEREKPPVEAEGSADVSERFAVLPFHGAEANDSMFDLKPEGTLPSGAFVCHEGKMIAIKLPARPPHPELFAYVRLSLVHKLWPVRIYLDRSDPFKQFVLVPPIEEVADYWRLQYRRVRNEKATDFVEERLFVAGMVHPCGPNGDWEAVERMRDWTASMGSAAVKGVTTEGPIDQGVLRILRSGKTSQKNSMHALADVSSEGSAQKVRSTTGERLVVEDISQVAIDKGSAHGWAVPRSGEPASVDHRAMLANPVSATGMGHKALSSVNATFSDDPFDGMAPESTLHDDAFACNEGAMVGIRLPGNRPRKGLFFEVKLEAAYGLWPVHIYSDISDRRNQFHLCPPLAGITDHWRLLYGRASSKIATKLAEHRLFEVGKAHPCALDGDREAKEMAAPSAAGFAGDPDKISRSVPPSSEVALDEHAVALVGLATPASLVSAKGFVEHRSGGSTKADKIKERAISTSSKSSLSDTQAQSLDAGLGRGRRLADASIYPQASEISRRGELTLAPAQTSVAQPKLSITKDGGENDTSGSVDWDGMVPEGALASDAFVCYEGLMYGITLPEKDPHPETFSYVKIQVIPQWWPIRVYLDMVDHRKHFFLYPPVQGNTDHWRLYYRRAVRVGALEYEEERFFEAGTTHPCGPNGDWEAAAEVAAIRRSSPSSAEHVAIERPFARATANDMDLASSESVAETMVQDSEAGLVEKPRLMRKQTPPTT